MIFTKPLKIAPAYRRAVWMALAVQVPVGLLCSLILDGGRLAKIFGAACVGFWIGAALIIARRPQNPHASDLFFLRWGIVIMVLIAIAAITILTRLRFG